jgi:hypothetical protein
MNDLKHMQMQVVRTFSDDILMEFGLHKCAKIELKKVALIHTQNFLLGFSREIKELRQGKTYKNVENFFKNEGIKYQEMKDRFKKEYTRRLRMKLKSE